MQTDFKIVQTLEDGQGVHVTARIYKGKVTTEDEGGAATGAIVPVTRYRRLGLLREVKFDLVKGTTKNAVETKLKMELAKDKIRDTIPEQA